MGHDDATPAELCDMANIHLLRICFARARQLCDARETLIQRNTLSVMLSCVNHPAVQALCEKVHTTTPQLPSYDEIHEHPSHYAHMLKGIILKYVAYHLHHDKHPDRLFCKYVVGHLIATMYHVRVAFFHRSDYEPRWICPIDVDGYYSVEQRNDFGDSPILLHCQQEETTEGRRVFVLIRPSFARTLATPRQLDTLRLVRVGTDGETDVDAWDSFDHELDDVMMDASPTYMLRRYQNSPVDGPINEPVTRFHPIGGSVDSSVYHALITHTPEDGQLFQVYPGEEIESLLLPFPPGQTLHVFEQADSKLAHVLTIASHDVFMYFPLSRHATQVLITMAENSKLAHDSILAALN